MRYLVALALVLAAACSGPECNHERSGPCPDGYFCSTYYGECREIVHYDGGQTDAARDAASDAGNDAQVCDAMLGGHCYRALPEASSWDDAQLSCELSGGHLVTIGNDAEQAIAWSLAMGIGPTVWIGATDEGSEAVWRWTTGEPFVSRWAATPIAQPDNAGSGQHCAHLWPEAGGLWADAACASMFPAICEID